MKSITILIFIFVFGNFDLTAQAIEVPTFSNETVIMKTCLLKLGSNQAYAWLTDGELHCSFDLKEMLSKREKEAESCYPQIAEIINQLRKQGYRLISTNGAETYPIYYFQK